MHATAIVRVLIIDDDRVARTLLRVVLKHVSGCEVSEAVDGRSACEILQQGPLPDLCITDFSMPDINGIQLLQQIRASPRWRNMEVILCTASADRNVVAKAASLRVAGYMVKPFEPTRLLEQIRTILDRVTTQKQQMLDALRARIGLNNEGCLKKLNRLGSDIGAAISGIRNCLSQGKFQPAKLRLNLLAKACEILPAGGLHKAIQSVDDALQMENLELAVESLETLESESQSVLSLADSLRAKV
ncbi:MAG TPA: response regulator [Candidatus Limnocylindria bacterium]|nr:response regulator [Candidatus Limnocylindria bacterium]